MMKKRSAPLFFATFSVAFMISEYANAFLPLPTIDFSAITSAVQTAIDQVKSSTVVVTTTETIGKISSAIGDEVATVSKFVGDAKDEAEKKIKEAEVIKKQAEEYKAEFDEYKRYGEEKVEQVKAAKEKSEKLAEMAKNFSLDDATGMLKDKATSLGKDYASDFGVSDPEGLYDSARGYTDGVKDKAGDLNDKYGTGLNKDDFSDGVPDYEDDFRGRSDVDDSELFDKRKSGFTKNGDAKNTISSSKDDRSGSSFSAARKGDADAKKFGAELSRGEKAVSADGEFSTKDRKSLSDENMSAAGGRLKEGGFRKSVDLNTSKDGKSKEELKALKEKEKNAKYSGLKAEKAEISDKKSLDMGAKQPEKDSRFRAKEKAEKIVKSKDAIGDKTGVGLKKEKAALNKDQMLKAADKKALEKEKLQGIKENKSNALDKKSSDMSAKDISAKQLEKDARFEEKEKAEKAPALQPAAESKISSDLKKESALQKTVPDAKISERKQFGAAKSLDAGATKNEVVDKKSLNTDLRQIENAAPQLNQKEIAPTTKGFRQGAQMKKSSLEGENFFRNKKFAVSFAALGDGASDKSTLKTGKAKDGSEILPRKMAEYCDLSVKSLASDPKQIDLCLKKIVAPKLANADFELSNDDIAVIRMQNAADSLSITMKMANIGAGQSKVLKDLDEKSKNLDSGRNVSSITPFYGMEIAKAVKNYTYIRATNLMNGIIDNMGNMKFE